MCCDIYLETFAIANVFEFRCMVEAGYEYNTDIHLEPAILEQMLNKSPLKHVSKVSRCIIYYFMFNLLRV